MNEILENKWNRPCSDYSIKLAKEYRPNTDE